MKLDFNLTPHFTYREMTKSYTASRLGLSNECPDELIPNMLNVAEHGEIIRAYFKKPISVHSCFRSEEVNKAVGGSKTSAHKNAAAMDCTINGISVYDLCKWCSENINDFDQIIYEFGETGWMHIGFYSASPRKQLLTAIKRNGKTVYLSGLIKG